MEFQRETLVTSLTAALALILGTLGLFSTQTLQTIIYFILATPSFFLSIYATFFKDRLTGAIIVFPQPFDSRIRVGSNFQITGSVMNMGDMPTLVELFPHNPEAAELTKFRVFPSNPAQAESKPLLVSRFILHPGEIYFLETSVSAESLMNQLTIPFTKVDKHGMKQHHDQEVDIQTITSMTLNMDSNS